MSLQIVAVADSISKLTVTGVTLKDLNEIPTSVSARDCPILYPRPDGFISGFDPERMSMGSGSGAQLNVTYSLNYRFLFAKIGTERGLFALYPTFIAKIVLIADRMLVSDSITGLVDLQMIDIGEVGPVSDPMGNMFHGCDISFEVLEFVN